jgi:hypothetical protein
VCTLLPDSELNFIMFALLNFSTLLLAYIQKFTRESVCLALSVNSLYHIKRRNLFLFIIINLCGNALIIEFFFFSFAKTSWVVSA